MQVKQAKALSCNWSIAQIGWTLITSQYVEDSMSQHHKLYIQIYINIVWRMTVPPRAENNPCELDSEMKPFWVNIASVLWGERFVYIWNKYSVTWGDPHIERTPLISYVKALASVQAARVSPSEAILWSVCHQLHLFQQESAIPWTSSVWNKC